MFVDRDTDGRRVRGHRTAGNKKTERNRAMLARWREGWTLRELAREYGISASRVQQVLVATELDERRAAA
jgi:Mor family transcriptional regulator